FNRMVDSLQRRIDREHRLFGDVSHELRTPLTTLTASVEVLNRHRDDLPERSRRALALVTAEVDHLRRLLDDLLALARVEAGMHHGDADPLSVAE
ncbi:histidine kinase dimerization/phospho-acceptor domain-containing protein, partial [Nocardia farcinica]